MILLAALIALLSFESGVTAQARSVYWQRWDVLIDDLDMVSNRFRVAETHDVHFNGTFRFGLRVVALTNLEAVDSVQVFEGNQPLTPRSSCTEEAGTYCTTLTTDGLDIRYFFTQPVTNTNRVFTIEYTVLGALRVYEGGDQLWWTAIPKDHFGFSIGSSTVMVRLPSGFGPRPGVDPVEVYGAPGTVQVEDNVIIARTSGMIEGDGAFEIRAQFPHNPNARSPRWQGIFDEQREYDETVRPLLDVALLAIGALIGVGGPLAIFGLWYTRGRDPQVGPVPEYLAEPPSNLSPALVGSLVDERVDVRDIIATIIDLAHRGYLVIEEGQTEGVFGIGKGRTFSFKRTDKTLDSLRAFERRLMDRIFSGSMERSLDSLRNSFYATIPALQQDLYRDLVSEGLFPTAPESVRRRWGIISFLLFGLSFLVFFFAVSEETAQGGMLLCLPISLALSGIVALFFSNVMPAKTRKGAEEAAKWKAFYQYLRNLENYGTVTQAAVRFEEFLPYAVAFGVERSWVRRFSDLEYVPIPVWYYPTYIGGRWGQGYRPGTPLPRPDYGDVVQAGGSALDRMSGGLAGSLESISTGLTSLLDSAGRIMTSQPQSSGSSGRWSGGGRSWSGGGFSGGGSSGGGRAGFG